MLSKPKSGFLKFFWVEKFCFVFFFLQFSKTRFGSDPMYSAGPLENSAGPPPSKITKTILKFWVVTKKKNNFFFRVFHFSKQKKTTLEPLKGSGSRRKKIENRLLGHPGGPPAGLQIGTQNLRWSFAIKVWSNRDIPQGFCTWHWDYKTPRGLVYRTKP